MTRRNETQRTISLEELPLIGILFEAGAHGFVFDALILLGPVVLASIALFGRTVGTEALGTAYLLTFVGDVGYRWRSSSKVRTPP